MFVIPNKKTFRTDEVAQILGCSQRTIRRMIDRGEFPNAIRLVKRYIITKQDLELKINADVTDVTDT